VLLRSGEASHGLLYNAGRYFSIFSPAILLKSLLFEVRIIYLYIFALKYIPIKVTEAREILVVLFAIYSRQADLLDF
jgi:hypothetical protein